MLSPREMAIKEALIAEMGGLWSYAEHRKIKDAIDPEYVDRESARIRKAQRRMTALVLLAGALVLLHVGLTVQDSPVLRVLPPITAAIACITLTAGSLVTLVKRRMAFRIFMILADDEED